MPKEQTRRGRQRRKRARQKQQQKRQVGEVDVETLKVRSAAVVARHVDAAARTVSEIDPSEYHVGMNTSAQRQFADNQMAVALHKAIGLKWKATSTLLQGWRETNPTGDTPFLGPCIEPTVRPSDLEVLLSFSD